ncbi:MAG: acetate--CoA ligase family protein, partial [Burkholderiaceae bacterium]
MSFRGRPGVGAGSAALLGAFRGRVPSDVDALAQSIVTLSNFAMDNARHLESVEINPLMVREQGQGVVALDTVLITREPQTHADGDELRRQVLQTLPLFEMARMRAANTARRHPEAGFAGDSPESRLRWVNQFTHTRRLRSPEDREVVTPNNDTLFT